MAVNTVNISNYTDLLRSFHSVIENYLNRYVATVMPVVVVKVSDDKSYVDVKGVLNNIDSDGVEIENEAIANIPIMILTGAGVEINFNIGVGDFGLLIACKNDITNFKHTKNINSKIASRRTFSFSDGFYLPLTFNSVASGVRVKCGDNIVHVLPDKVKITAPKVEIKGDIEIMGDMKLSGDAKITGGVVADKDVIAGKVSLTKHTHNFNDSTIYGSVDKVTLPPNP